MKVATWNIERLAHKNKLEEIESICDGLQADILVLTEADRSVSLKKYKNCFYTPAPPDLIVGTGQSVPYRETECRVAVYTNYRCIRLHNTGDNFTSLCVELETENGPLLVYGTIIGILGNRSQMYMKELDGQISDIEQLARADRNLCACGDFNCSFADGYYFTNAGRDRLRRCCSENGMVILTEEQSECIDHIAVSEKMLSRRDIQIQEWNTGKELSDHKGIAVRF